LAEDLGMTVLEMNQLMCEDHKYDNMIDDTTAKIAKENANKAIVFDSRLAWNFVETSFKVFLSVSLDVAASRVYADNRGAVEKYSSVEDAKGQLKLRAETENKRYKDIYDLDYFNFKNYNLILDSTYCTPELLAHVIIKEAKSYDKTVSKILMTTKRLGFEAATYSSILENYQSEGDIVIEKNNDDFKVISGIQYVEEAARKGIPFVSVRFQ
jgi:cytidylate kinase